MSEQPNTVQTPFQTKTYVRGTFLYSTDDGNGYEQKNRNRVEDQIIIEDKANVGSLKREIQQKKQELNKRKEKVKKQKLMLIPIRDTPVEPLPQPMMDNNKCQRATQEQFQYFQTYISLKQKQRKFQEQERGRIEEFQRYQQSFRKNQTNQDRKGISIVMEKDTNESHPKTLAKKRPAIKVVIKKKIQQPSNPAGYKDESKIQKKGQSPIGQEGDLLIQKQQQVDVAQTKNQQNRNITGNNEAQEDNNFQKVVKVRVI